MTDETKFFTIEIYTDVKCKRCERYGATQNGFCLGCMEEWFGGKIKLNGLTYEQFSRQSNKEERND